MNAILTFWHFQGTVLDIFHIMFYISYFILYLSLHWILSPVRKGPQISYSIFKVYLLNWQMWGKERTSHRRWQVSRPLRLMRPETRDEQLGSDHEHTGSAYNLNIYLLNKVECPSANYSHRHWPLLNISLMKA